MSDYNLTYDGNNITVTAPVTDTEIDTLKAQYAAAKTAIAADVAAVPTADLAELRAIMVRQLNREDKEIDAILRTILWVEDLRNKAKRLLD